MCQWWRWKKTWSGTVKYRWSVNGRWLWMKMDVLSSTSNHTSYTFTAGLCLIWARCSCWPIISADSSTGLVPIVTMKIISMNFVQSNQATVGLYSMGNNVFLFPLTWEITDSTCNNMHAVWAAEVLNCSYFCSWGTGIGKTMQSVSLPFYTPSPSVMQK